MKRYLDYQGLVRYDNNWISELENLALNDEDIDEIYDSVFHPEEKWIITVEATKNNKNQVGIPITLYYSTNDNNMFVDWGDGSTSTLTSADYSATYASGSVHVYQTSGIYKIRIYANDWSNIYFLVSRNYTYNISSTSYSGPVVYYFRESVLAINNEIPCIGGIVDIQSGSGSLRHNNSLEYIFRECKYLSSIPSNLFVKNPNVTNFYGCFHYCYRIETIPENLFIYSVNATDFSYCFYECGFKNIPENIFSHNSLATSFSHCFAGNYSLKEIPENIFKYNPDATDFSSCFSSCSNITEIPSKLFSNASKATNFSGCFAYCQKIKTIPQELFTYNIKATDFNNCFATCSQLTSIPSELFVYASKATNFSGCFKGCTKLLKIPYSFFDNCISMTDVSSCFENCNKLTSIPNWLFAFNSSLTTVYSCFKSCTKIKTFNIAFSARNISSARDFVYYGLTGTSNRIICAPSDSTTYSTLSSSSLGIIISTDGLSCAEAWEIIIDTEAGGTGNCKTGIPFNLRDQNNITLTVDWGDGTTSTLVSTDYQNIYNDTSASLHEYENPGRYTITIISNNWNETYLYGIASSVYSSATNHASIYWFRQTLIQINDPLPKVKGIALCPNSYVTGFNLYNKSLEYLFGYCSKLSVITEDLFVNNQHITKFDDCFGSCTSLTKIPNIFKENISAISFAYCFRNCSYINSVSADLFFYNKNAKNLNACFNGCTRLKNFKIKIGSPNVSSLEINPYNYPFIPNASDVERVLCVEENTQTYTTARNLANESNNIIVSTDFVSCTEPMEFTVEVESYYGIYRSGIPFTLYGQDDIKLVVDWGDGCISRLTSFDYSEDNSYESTHDYTSSGNYQISIYSSDWRNTYMLATNSDIDLSTNDNSKNAALYWFRRSVVSIDSPLPPLKGVVDFYNYNSSAPQFYEDTLQWCFCGCTSLASIPVGLFDNNATATSFELCFSGCSSLASIPSGLFDSNTAVTSFSYCFQSCSSLQSIPSGLFNNNTAVTHFSHCFRNCSIQSIPSGLFNNNTVAKYFEYCFSGCSSLASIPSGLFSNNTAVLWFEYCFSKCTSLVSIPTGLFDNNTNVTFFDYCFSECSSLQSVPSGLFTNNTAVTNFSGCFQKCSTLNDFTLHIGSTKVSYCGSFVTNKSGTTRTIYVPSGSSTETKFNSYASSLGLTIIGE